MFITHDLISYLRNHYTNEGTLEFSRYAFVINQMEDNVGSDFSSIAQNIKTIESQYSVRCIKDAIKGIIYNLQGTEFGHFIEGLEELITTCLRRIKVLPETIEDLRILKTEDWNKFISTLTGTKRAIATLIWNTGMMPCDLQRIEDLDEILSGVIRITRFSGMTQVRTLNSMAITGQPAFGLNPDDAGLLIDVLKSVTSNRDNLGKVVHDRLGEFMYGWEYTPTQLRTSHAIRLLNEGKTYEEIALIQGVKTATLEKRVNKYLEANQ